MNAIINFHIGEKRFSISSIVFIIGVVVVVVVIVVGGGDQLPAIMCTTNSSRLNTSRIK
jgi:hypothetical protein